ncbi:SMI1/KNR4 family protein [Acinetobacter nematophilus]|uniref:SMI1/KNR4 family protein n=1 Tax=Acinetobacter nematophilus TaxID=2994642 RepID=A0A9X3IHG4_9GAMM|nr:SMI1/KNR4 family protein [Acinetobacter nematophilus]MCX5468923.1 SMI1/KNR4 family protein [Acinetobacter nematophilus]
MDIRRDNGKNSLDEIKRVQNELGYFFPNNYIDLIRNHDALRFEKNIFDFKNIYNKEDERDLNFLSFKSDHLDGDILSNQDNVNDLENYGIKDLVVFGICANGDYICFDYREDSKTSNPKIVLVYHDDFVDFDDGTSSMVVNDVANNFDEFLKLLHE